MSRSVLLSCVLAGALVAAGLAFIAGQASAAAGPDVTVTNVPLPVQVVNPANSPSSVNIGNVTDLAKAFGVQQPVAFSLDGNSKDPAVHKYTVPLGRRLVIEYVSGTCLANGSVNGLPPFYDDLQISAVTGGVTNLHRLQRPINPIPYNGSLTLGQLQTAITMAHLVKIYADPGTDVTILPSVVICQLAFSGQLVTVP